MRKYNSGMEEFIIVIMKFKYQSYSLLVLMLETLLESIIHPGNDFLHNFVDLGLMPDIVPHILVK